MRDILNITVCFLQYKKLRRSQMSYASFLYTIRYTFCTSARYFAAKVLVVFPLYASQDVQT